MNHKLWWKEAYCYLLRGATGISLSQCELVCKWSSQSEKLVICQCGSSSSSVNISLGIGCAQLTLRWCWNSAFLQTRRFRVPSQVSLVRRCGVRGHGRRTRFEETALRRRVGRVDYWLGAHHATAGSKERVGGVGAHEKWRRTESTRWGFILVCASYMVTPSGARVTAVSCGAVGVCYRQRETRWFG
jgi:hypothetical protein